MSNKNTIQLEITPRVYYEYYHSPDYDLYPGLCRKLGNGHVKRKPIARRQQNFISLIPSHSSTRFYNENEDPLWRPHTSQPDHNTTPPWDLYPAILRNVENFGSEEMRERLHMIQNSIM